MLVQFIILHSTESIFGKQARALPFCHVGCCLPYCVSCSNREIAETALSMSLPSAQNNMKVAKKSLEIVADFKYLGRILLHKKCMYEKHSEYEIHGMPSGIHTRIFFLPVFYPKT